MRKFHLNEGYNPYLPNGWKIETKTGRNDPTLFYKGREVVGSHSWGDPLKLVDPLYLDYTDAIMEMLNRARDYLERDNEARRDNGVKSIVAFLDRTKGDFNGRS